MTAGGQRPHAAALTRRDLLSGPTAGCSARGPLDAVVRVVQAGRYCTGVLHRLLAVEAAIARARRAICEGQARGCVTDAVRGGQIAIGDVADEVLAAGVRDRRAGRPHRAADRAVMLARHQPEPAGRVRGQGR